MKKTIIILLSAVAITSCALLKAAPAAEKTIHVSTAQEFIEAIGSNRTVIIDESFMELTPALLDAKNKALKVSYDQAATTSKKVFYVDEFDGPELHIANVQNLKIVAGQDIVVLQVDPRYANVISFERSSGITLKGITFGHSEEGYCSQGVLGFENCSDVIVDRCDLFGCGTEGINVQSCSNVMFKATKIRDCSYHIMHLGSSSHITFDGCQFFRNREFSQVNIYECTNVLFDNCMFANNTGELFNVQCPITLKDCVILHDTMFWGDEEGNVEYINCVTEEYFNSEQALG